MQKVGDSEYGQVYWGYGMIFMLGGLWLLFFAKVVIFVIIDSHAHYNNSAYAILFSAVTIIHDSLIQPQKGTSANPFRS